MTGIARISAALQEIGVLGASQTASGALGAFALATLVRMVNAWAADSLTSHAELRTVKALTSGARDYTIGPGGVIDIARPMAITKAGMILDSTVTDPEEVPITVYTDQDWAAIRRKTLDAGQIEGVYYDKAFSSTGRGTVSTYPTINISNVQVVLYSHLAIVGPSDMATDLTFPPAYDEALHFNLAKRLCRPLGRPLTADLEDDANRTLAVVRLANHKPVELTLNGAVPGVVHNDVTGWFD